jgi:hypothetical protein
MLNTARQDPNILGLFVGGSRGKGATTIHSDYEIQRIIDEKGTLAPDIARERLPIAIDAYINSAYRSLKNKVIPIQVIRARGLVLFNPVDVTIFGNPWARS